MEKQGYPRKSRGYLYSILTIAGLENKSEGYLNPSRLPLQAAELLETVVYLNLADVEVAVGIGPDAVGTGFEFAGFVAGLGAAPVAEEFAVEGPDADALLEFGDVDDFAIGVEVNGIGFEQAGAFLKEVAVGVKELNAVIGAVADPNAIVFVQPDAVGEGELAGPFAPVAPGVEQFASG